MRSVRRQQRGIVAALVAVALLGVLLMAGLAIDIGHLVLNKSRLQSTVDAAALAAAKVLDQTGSEDQATAAARGVFNLNAAKQPELSRVLSGADLVVQYSATLNPFAPGAPDATAEYVRVIADNFSMWTSFTVALGFDQMTTRASAVSGPSAPIGSPCDLFPVAVCADMTKGPPYWGYTPYPAGNAVVLLKLASVASGTTFGPGNFQLIRIGGTGASVVRENMAGGAACVGPNGMADVDPQPGNVIGPVSQGLNTRFGLYTGTMSGKSGRYPPDFVTTPSPKRPLGSPDGTTITYDGVPITGVDDIGFSYKDYEAAYDAEPPSYTNPEGRAQRRLVTVPIVDCTNPVPGTAGVLPVMAFGSFFLLQPVEHGSGTDAWIFAQFLGEGRASGSPGPNPGTGPYKIVLHNDPDSDDS